MSSPFSLRFEWLDGNGISGPELAATFARLEIRSGDLCATRVVDRERETARDAVYVPLYPLAEWFSTHWWRLWSEPENRRNSPDFAEAHELWRADSAYALPKLTLVSAGATARLDIRRRRMAHQPLDFVEEGERWIPTDGVIDEARRLVEAVTERLRIARIEHSILEDLVEQRMREERDPDRAFFCRTAAALGLDPDAVPEDTARSLREAREVLKPSTVEDVCASIEPESVTTGVAWVRRAREALASLPSSRGSDGRAFARELRRSAQRVSHATPLPPWKRGYEIAHRVAEAADLASVEPGARWDRLMALLEMRNELVQVERVDGIAAMSLAPEEDDLRIAVTPRHPAGRRFAAARALCDFLLTGSREPRLATRAETERQKASRAFAAELLAPAEDIANRLPRERVLDWSDVEELAATFGVSSEVVRHQIENHRLARISS